LVTEPGVSSTGVHELQNKTGEGFGQFDGLVAEEQPNCLVVGGDVVDGESPDGCGPLGVEQNEQAGDPVLRLERVVVQEPAGLFPAGFGVDGLLGPGPFDGGELEVGELLVLGRRGV
jgi:hypothetical protein